MRTLALVVLGGIAILYFAVTEALDWAGRFEYMQTHFPRLLKWSERKRWRVILALVGLCLLGTAIYDLSKQSRAVKRPQVFKETQSESAPPPTPQSNQTVKTANAASPTPGPRHQKGSKNQEREPHKLMPAEKPEESKAARGPTPQQPASIISAPNGIAIGGGLVANPTVNNFGPAPAHLSYTEEVVTPLPASGGGLKIMKIHITTDRSIRGAIVGIVFSEPIEPITPDKDQPQLKGAGISQMNWGGGLQRDNVPIPNALGIVVNAPAVFMPGQELIVTVKSKTDVRVIEVAPVQ